MTGVDPLRPFFPGTVVFEEIESNNGWHFVSLWKKEIDFLSQPVKCSIIIVVQWYLEKVLLLMDRSVK